MNAAVAEQRVYSLDEPLDDNKPLLFFFYAWTFILAARPQDVFPFLAPVRPVLLFGIFTFLCLLAVYLRGGVKLYLSGRQPLLYALFVVLLALSVPFGYYPKASAMALLKYTSAVFFFISFCAVVNAPEKLTTVLKILCVGMFVYAVYSLLTGQAMGGRLVAGQMYDPNDLGYFLISLLTFNFLFLSAPHHWLLRLICMANLLIGPVAILMTGSRGGFVALAVVILMLVFGKARLLKASHRALFIGVLLFGIVAAGSAIEFSRFGTFLHPTKDYNYTSETGRLAVWKTGAKVMLSNPLLGIGMDCYAEAMGRERVKSHKMGRWQAAHNSWLQVGAEAGLIAFVLFGLLNLFAYRSFDRARRESASEEFRRIAGMAKIGFVGHFLGAIFLSQAYAIYWVFYLALSVALPRLALTAVDHNSIGSEPAVQ